MPPTTTGLYTQSTGFSHINLYLRKYPQRFAYWSNCICWDSLLSDNCSLAKKKNPKKSAKSLFFFFSAMHTEYITKERDSDHDPIASSKLVFCVFKVFSLTYPQSAFVKWRPVVLFISPFCLQLIHHQIPLIPTARCISNPPIAFRHGWPCAMFVHRPLLGGPLVRLPALARASVACSLCTAAKSIISQKLTGLFPF